MTPTDGQPEATLPSFWRRFVLLLRGLSSRCGEPYQVSDGQPGNRKLGQHGEELALRFLQHNGYQLLTRNFTTRQGEIDLILRQERTVVFVEVKTRTSEEFARGEHAITPRKQHRMRRAARQFIRRNQLGRFPARFDAVIVILQNEQKPDIRHYPHAFSL